MTAKRLRFREFIGRPPARILAELKLKSLRIFHSSRFTSAFPFGVDFIGRIVPFAFPEQDANRHFTELEFVA